MINPLIARAAGLSQWADSKDGDEEWVGTRSQWNRYDELEKNNEQ